MNKKFSTAVALGLAFGFAFSAYGCNKEKPQDPTPTPQSYTEEQIFTSTVSSLEKLASYTSAITYDVSSVYNGEETVGSETEKETQYSNIFISYDPITKNFLAKEEYTSGTSTTIAMAILRKDGEQYYSYSTRSRTVDGTTTTDEDCYTVSEEYVDLTIEMIFEEYSLSVFADYIPKASFAEIKNAYQTVYSEQLTERRKTDTTANASASVSATNTDGEFEVNISTAVEKTEEEIFYTRTQELVLIAKNNRFHEGYLNRSASSKQTEDGQTVSTRIEEKNTFKISYTFAQADFDAITFDKTIAEEMEHSEYPTKEIQFAVKVGDYTYNYSRNEVENSTAEFFFQYTTLHDFNNTSNYTWSWYTDASCTTPVDWTDKTPLDLQGNTYYGKPTVVDGKALILTHFGEVDNRSKAYKIVFNSPSFRRSSSDMSTRTIDNENPENNVYTFDQNYISENTLIYVNGVKQAKDVENFTMESNGFYVVNYQTALVDKNYDIFEIIN